MPDKIPLTPVGANPRLLPQGVAAPAEWQEPALDYMQGLGASALSGITELVGYTVPGAEEFRREQPIAGALSQFASVAVPYGGWFAGARRIPQFMKVVDKLSKIEKSPFLAGAAREAAILAPFEVGRVGASQLVGDESLADMTTEAALDLVLSGGIGGALHSFAAAGKRASRTPIPGLDLGAPPPLQLRRMKEMLAEHAAKGDVLTPEQQGAITNKIKDMDQKARTEKVSGDRYVSKVNNNDALTRQLNSYFSAGGPGMLRKRWFAVGENGFATEDEWRQAAKWNFLPDNFAETGRYFRELTFKPTGGDEGAAEIKKLSDKLLAGTISPDEYTKLVKRMASGKYAAERAKRVDKELRAGMQSMGFGWLMGKEESGLLIIAKKTHGKFGKGAVDDRWVLFKTDVPGTYLPQHKAWSDMVIEANSWGIAAQPFRGVNRIYGAGRDFNEIFDRGFHETVNTTGRLKALLPKQLSRSSSELVRGVADSAREYLAPAVAQFRKSALGKQIFMTAKLMHDLADTMAHEIVFGKLAPSKGSAFRQAISPSQLDPDVDSISSILAPLSDSQVDELVKLSNDLVDPARYDELVASGALSAPARAAADRLEILADVVDIEHRALAEFLGKSYGQRAKGNLGLVRKWEGDARIQLSDETGKPVAVVSGKTKKAAQQTAARVVSENPGWHISEQVDISKIAGMEKRKLAISAEIKSTTGKTGGMAHLRGFKGDFERIDRKELLQDFQQAYAGKFKWQAREGVEDLLAQSRAILNETDPTTTRILNDRLRDMSGEQSEFSKWQNMIADRLLAPMIGPNSASKIVAATNTGLAVWHLGMGNVAHPIMNMLTFVSNVTPEIAFIIGATDKDLGGYYSHSLAGGTRGPIAASAMLSPVKILFQSFRAMANPSEQAQRFYARAAGDSTLQPRVAEEFTGLNATRVADLKGAFSSPGGFANWVKELAIWMPANSERMSRIHSFTVGHIVGRDVLGIVDEEALYRFSKEFTERTMFNYTTADRPRIFTTPAGSAMGLFKTWMMNYMAAMLEYTGQAAKGNVAPLFWQTAGTAAVGGVAATPLYWIADGFSKAFTDESLIQQTYDNMSEGPADALMFGMPAALTGISLYSQSTSPMSNPQRDASMLWSFVLQNRAAAMSRTIGAAIDNWRATGQHPGNSSAVRDGLVQALAPSTIARAVSAFSGDDMIRSLASGYPLISSVPLGDRFLYALKLNPVELDRAMAVADELYKNRAAERAAVMRLGRAFAEASDNNDPGGVNEVIMQATAWGIDPSKVLDSAMKRGMLAAEPLIERTFSPQNVQPYLPVLGR